MTQVQRLSHLARTDEEVWFYLYLHPCPGCGDREIGAPRYQGVPVDRPDMNQWKVCCPKCRFERHIEFALIENANQRHEAFRNAYYRQAGLRDANDDFSMPTPEPIFRGSLHLGDLDGPSQIIEAHELAAELTRLDGLRPPDLTILDYSAYKAADEELLNGLTCAYELRKFYPEGASEIPEHHVRSDDARRARAEHPEWFRRDWVDVLAEKLERIAAKRWAEAARRAALPPDDPRSRNYHGYRPPPILPPLSRPTLMLHERWVEHRGAQGERLIARDVDAAKVSIVARDLTEAVLEGVKLEQADLSHTKLQGAELMGVVAREANFTNAMIAGATIERCDFHGAIMQAVKLGDSVITETDFSGADLRRATWFRAEVTGCTFREADMTNMAFDKAVFRDCDLRGVDLGARDGLLGTAMDAQFIDCDLRGSSWDGLDLFRTRFINCKMAGIRGTPRLSETVVENADLSEAGDSSFIGGLPEVAARWEQHVDAAVMTRAKAQQIIDADLDAGASFEEIIEHLVQVGFSREDALTAMTEPDPSIDPRL